MTKTRISASTFTGIIVMAVAAQSPVAGIWQAEVLPNLIWTMQLRADGGRLTGSIEGGSDPSEIYDGTIYRQPVAGSGTEELLYQHAPGATCC